MKIEDLKFITNKDNIISVQVYIPLGSIHEKKGQSGISHFLEHMKFKRTNKYKSKNDFLEELSSSTTVTNAYTTKDHTSYYIRTLDKNWEKVIKLMYEIVFNTKFNTNDIKLEKKVILEEKLTREGNLESINDIDIHSETSILDPKNPYSRRPIGSMTDIKKMTKKNLQEYNKKYIDNYLIVISCSTTLRNKIKNLCLKLFPDSTNKKQVELENTKSFKYSLTIRNLGLPQNNIYIAFKSFSEMDNNKYYLGFIEDILANQRGSILYKKLRKDKGYVYGVHTMNESYKDYGCFRILISSDVNNDINNILNIVFSELVNLKKKGLTDKQLEKYKKQFIDHTSYYFKDNDVIINTFGSYLYYDRDFTFKKYINLINKITKNKILEIINQLFDFKKMGFVLYGNVKDIEKRKKGIINIINKYKNLSK